MCRITAGSRFPGNGRTREVTEGHHAGGNRVQGDTQGVRRTREDTPSRRFGTVRPRVQIPGPRPNLYPESAISGVVRSRRGTDGAQIRWDLIGISAGDGDGRRPMRLKAQPLIVVWFGLRKLRPDANSTSLS